VIWDRGRVRALGTLGGGFAQPYAISDRGTVVGSSLTAEDRAHAFIWRGTMTDIELGTTGDERTATDVNNHDAVLVESTTGGFDPTREFLWRHGTATELPGLVPGGYVEADQINDRGQIAGMAGLRTARSHAVLWRT